MYPSDIIISTSNSATQDSHRGKCIIFLLSCMSHGLGSFQCVDEQNFRYPQFECMWDWEQYKDAVIETYKYICTHGLKNG